MKKVYLKDFVIGEIYTAGNSGNVFCWGGKDARFWTGGSRNSFHSAEGGYFHSDAIEATPFEKAWLLEMIRVNGFIPEEEFMEQFLQPEYSIY